MDPTTSRLVSAARDSFARGKVANAEGQLRLLLSEEPNEPAALTLLGGILLRTGRFSEAQSLLGEAYRLSPNEPETVLLNAIARRSGGNFAAAAELFQRFIELGQESADVLNQLGSCRLELDDAIGAGAAFKRAIELDRNAANSYYNLGMALKLAGTSFETFLTFKRAIELNPNYLDSYIQLSEAMRKLLNWREGLPLLEQGFRRHPNSMQMMLALASAYAKVGFAKRADELYRAAAKLDPSALTAYAHWLHEEGRFEDSIPVLKEAIARAPIQGQAYFNLAVAKCFEIDGVPLTKTVRSLEENPAIAGEERMFAYYALARAYEHERNYEAAMHYYDLANDQAYQAYNSDFVHDEQAVEADHATLVAIYSKHTMDRLRKFGSTSEVPIFIVGMIRTGTTLLDQILSSHRDVRSAGEQPFWQVSTGRVNRRWLESGGNPEDLRELERKYLGALREAAGEAPRITDKMPTNFAHMGLMSVVFPKAKFIHLRRSPMDTCLSIYMTFLGNSTPFAYNQANIVGFYRSYMKSMEYWRTVIPAEQMIEIDYEDLVTNKEAVLREVLGFCGLDWDDAVLSHERNVSQVSTPSLWTARQPVNTASVERWRRYEPWLGKLLELRDVTHPKRSNADL